jgi:predicted enzyme related to lactoylglutathione lyase
MSDQAETPETPTRLSVNISRSTVDALQEVVSDNGISMTEAVRRLIGYGIVMYRADKDGYDIQLRQGTRLEKIVFIE